MRSDLKRLETLGRGLLRRLLSEEPRFAKESGFALKSGYNTVLTRSVMLRVAVLPFLRANQSQQH